MEAASARVRGVRFELDDLEHDVAREGNVSEEWSDDLANTPLSEAWLLPCLASDC